MTLYKSLTVMAGVICLGSGSVSAAVYKSIDAQGNVVYTDEPQDNAKPLELPPLSTIPPPKSVNLAPAEKSDSGDADTKYEQITIISPTQDETLRNNAGNVNVSMALSPGLNKAAGHRIQFFLDGQTYGEPGMSENIVFQQMDRGTHTVEAAVVDGSGKELLRSSANRFYLHRESINFRRGVGNPTP